MGRRSDNAAACGPHQHHHDHRAHAGHGGPRPDAFEPWGGEPRGERRRQRGGPGPGPWGGWGEHDRPHRGGGPGMPPWVAGLFGMGRPEGGPRVRRGDVRSAILDVLRTAAAAETSPNGYQVITRITERSGGAWKPSPGSVYPTLQQLQDEGLVEIDESAGGRAVRLTAAGARWCEDNTDELAGVWAPFDRAGEGGAKDGRAAGRAEIKSEIGQVMSAVWQVVSTGSESQRQAAVDVLVDARRRLYGILADGPEGPRDPE